MPHVEFDESSNTFTVRTVWNEKELIQSIPGARWDANSSIWRTPATWASLVVLRGVFQAALTFGESAITRGWDIRQGRVDPALLSRSEIEPIDDDSPEMKVIASWRS